MMRIVIPLEVRPVPPQAFQSVQTLHGGTMGTSWSAKFVGASDADFLASMQRGVQSELDAVVDQMSTWRCDSHLSRFNRSVPGTWQDLPSEFFYVLDYALSLAERTDGAYDPTAGPLVNLWGFGPEQTRNFPPSKEEIEIARKRVGWNRVEFDRKGKRVLQTGGAYLDLSSIAKGFGVDQIAAYLKTRGIFSFLVEVGGELCGSGMKPDGQPWWVALETPTGSSTQTATETLVALHGLSVATSGDYQRYFYSGSTRYSHTIDPRSGYPICHSLASVTVIHSNCMVADALATALTVLGTEPGAAFAEKNDIAALFINRRGEGLEETITSSLTAMLSE
jgi:thiamine biosynthesis lipoprotein